MPFAEVVFIIISVCNTRRCGSMNGSKWIRKQTKLVFHPIRTRTLVTHIGALNMNNFMEKQSENVIVQKLLFNFKLTLSVILAVIAYVILIHNS